MRNVIFLVIIMSAILLGCSQQTSTSSAIMVIEKKYSEDYKEAWIMAYDPNNSTREHAIKIMVEEPMVWNLLEKEKEYFATYDKTGDKPWVLEQIQHPTDNDTLR